MKTFSLNILLFFEISSLLSRTRNVAFASEIPTATDSLISLSNHSLSMEKLIDSRFKHLAVGFQDQIDELKIKVNQLEAEKSGNIEINTSHSHGLEKREATVSEKKIPACLNRTSICTLYFPDHPDAISNQTKFGSLVKNISSSARSLCTLYFPDHPDAYTKQGKTNTLVPNDEMAKNTDNKTIRGIQTNCNQLVTSEVPKSTDNMKIGVVMQTPIDAHSKKDSFSAEVTNEVFVKTDKVIGMPTSCKDLQQLGHKLNGFYSIKAEQENQTAKIETVYCDFQSSPNLKVFETRIGVNYVRSSPVHFSVKVEQDFYGEAGKKIKFLQQVVNIGNGFDWENQWFRAPYSGTYFFSVSGSMATNVKKVDIWIFANENGIGGTITSGPSPYNGFSCQLSIKLNASDKIELKMHTGKTSLLYFTGWMAEEDLSI